ncbi:uncharacterized protein LOC142233897 [Haematobia irritans]|uniref:uncharacterized protein LOC142233897 n=1 Tax=Haematobia irritans TaxID=7368 RepID=UPI003F4F3FDE
MPPKKTRKSRLNSNCDIRIIKKSSSSDENLKTLKKSEENFLSENSKYGNESIIVETSKEDNESSIIKIKGPLTRTYLLISDYHKFKAARCIQRFVRGWLARLTYQRKKWAVIIIQKEWRRFYAQLRYYKKLEDLVQRCVEEHYFRSAQKIQALWRGWWVREHIHNHKELLRSQLMAGEDLLHCVAYKLHHLLRTHQIPGIYSLRNSTAFSKVETLLSSMTFKIYTDRTRKAHGFRENQKKQARREFEKSSYATQVPFPGPNIQNICKPKCMQFYSEKDVDRKMTRILKMYEEANRKSSQGKEPKQKSKDFPKQPGKCFKQTPTTFCGDVVRSMKKWKIIDEQKLQLDPYLFQCPENLENFLKEAESWWSLLHGTCNCRSECIKEIPVRNLPKSTKKG